MIELGARMIASLTSCVVATYIDTITTRHHILHYAIPRPLCLTRPTTPSDGSMHTLWHQPEPSDLAYALYKINEIENAGRSLILSNGRSNLPKILLELSTSAITQGNKFKPVYVTQDFSTIEDEKSFFPGTYTARTSLDSVLSVLTDSLQLSSAAPSLNHVIIMAPRHGVFEILKKMVLYSSASKNYMWMFGEPIGISLKSVLTLLSEYPIKTMNVAFFRYLPILNREDCHDDNMNKLLRDTAIHFSDCDFTKLPERVAILVSLMNLYAHVRQYSVKYFQRHTADVRCSAVPIQTDQAGLTALNLSKQLGVLHKLSGLTFYALEIDINNMTRFVATARYDGSSVYLTEDGKEVAKQALISGLFPNRFRNFTKGMLTVGMVLVSPFVMDYEISPAGYVTKARGMMIDLLDILAKRFNFWYRIYPATDGHYGEFSLRGEWTGLIGDLQNKRIDLAASCLVQNRERDGAGTFLGHVLDGRLALLLARPKTVSKPFSLIQIFQPQVLGLLVLCSVINTIFSYLYGRYSPYSLRNQNPPAKPLPERIHMVEHVWDMFKCTMFQCIQAYPTNPSSRCMILAQWTMAFLIYLAWQCDVTSFLTRKIYNPRIRSLSELAEDMSMKPLIVKGSGVYEFFEESNVKQVYKEIFRRILKENLIIPNHSVAVSMVLSNPDYVIVGDYETLLYAQLRKCQDLIVINTNVVMGQQSLMALPDVDWAKPFSTYLDQLKEGGVVDALTTRWWELNSSCTTTEDNFRPINTEAMGELYLVFAVFMAAGLLLLIGELLWGSVILPRLQRRRQRLEAKKARRERRFRRSQARLARKSTVESEQHESRHSGTENTE
ncbi:hypothetical protein D915_002310 [Fasciola hepatica]|uniref:Uncharacterized protein n=1 Tax=Fasciola hepatica TaxID=6192 RepID=A0A4E0RH16_FASHE|nr:hypothetical protein D915_002310 [Fasciola hepatica]